MLWWICGWYVISTDGEQDVYYLMVINMPTDAEIEQAKGVIAHDGGLMQ